ncbi:MAG: T9SS type A sorting domain-containing protein [Bacteroidota bacterium]
MNSNNSINILIIFICSLGIQLNAFADDVTATTTATIGTSSSGSVTLTITGGTAPYTYSWTGPGGYTNNIKDIAGVDSGEYCVTIIDAYCGTTTICARVGYSAQNTGIINTSDNQAIVLFPNPFTNEIVIQSDLIKNKDLEVQLFTIKGQLVYTFKGHTTESKLKLSGLQQLTKGTYTIIAKNKEQLLFARPLIKE